MSNWEQLRKTNDREFQKFTKMSHFVSLFKTNRITTEVSGTTENQMTTNILFSCTCSRRQQIEKERFPKVRILIKKLLLFNKNVPHNLLYSVFGLGFSWFLVCFRFRSWWKCFLFYILDFVLCKNFHSILSNLRTKFFLYPWQCNWNCFFFS